MNRIEGESGREMEQDEQIVRQIYPNAFRSGGCIWNAPGWANNYSIGNSWSGARRIIEANPIDRAKLTAPEPKKVAPQGGEEEPQRPHRWTGMQEADGWFIGSCSCGWTYQLPHSGCGHLPALLGYWNDHVVAALRAESVAPPSLPTQEIGADYTYKSLYEKKAKQLASLVVSGDAASIDKVARLLASQDASRAAVPVAPLSEDAWITKMAAAEDGAMVATGSPLSENGADYIIGRCLPLIDILIHEGHGETQKTAKAVREEIINYVSPKPEASDAKV